MTDGSLKPQYEVLIPYNGDSDFEANITIMPWITFCMPFPKHLMLASEINPEILQKLSEQYPKIIKHINRLKPKIYKDGTTWCCFSGPNPVEGIFGCGFTIEEAVEYWEKAWQRKNKVT